MDWIMSEGGPLICLEKALEHSWGGVDRLTIADPSATTDYDRACATNHYLKVVPLVQSAAIAIGEGPMDTSTWHTPSGRLCIVQIFVAEPDIDENAKLSKIDEAIFANPIILSEWQTHSSPLVIFDSAMPGSEPDKEKLSFDVRPSRYRIQTQVFDPDPEVSFLLHRFDPID